MIQCGKSNATSWENQSREVFSDSRTPICSGRPRVRPQPGTAPGYWHTALARSTQDDGDSPELDYRKHRTAWTKDDGLRSRKRAGRTTWLRNCLAQYPLYRRGPGLHWGTGSQRRDRETRGWQSPGPGLRAVGTRTGLSDSLVDNRGGQ